MVLMIWIRGGGRRRAQVPLRQLGVGARDRALLMYNGRGLHGLGDCLAAGKNAK